MVEDERGKEVEGVFTMSQKQLQKFGESPGKNWFTILSQTNI